MADVFLSFTAHDRRRADRVARALIEAGLSVWWEEPQGADAASASAKRSELQRAAVVVALWSQSSIRSEAMRREAWRAQTLNKVLPVRLDDISIPSGFERYRSVDLSGWDGTTDAPQWALLVETILRKASVHFRDDETISGSVPGESPSQKLGPSGQYIPPAARQLFALRTDPLHTERSAEMRQRALELEYLFERAPAVQRSSLRGWTILGDYLSTYGRITPITLVALPHAMTEPEFKRLFGWGGLHQIFLEGRFVVLDVASSDAPPITAWKVARFGDRYFGSVGDGAVDAPRFAGALRKATQLLRNELRAWSEAKARARHDESDFTPTARGNLFISYSRRDASIVHPICAQLEELGASIWLDRTSIVGGEVCLQRLVEGLDRAGAVLPFCSSSFSTSQRCQREMLHAIDTRKRLAPVWVTPPPLEGEMKHLLGNHNGAPVCELTPKDAAQRLYARLAQRADDRP